MGVLAQSGGSIGVPKARLGLEDLPTGDQERRHGVAEPVQGRVGDTRCIPQLDEAVAEDLGAQPVLMGLVGGEQPRPHGLAGAGLPVGDEAVPPRPAVEDPMVITRPCPDFGVVITPAETARWMCRVRSWRSSMRNPASSPRRAPVSAARRTRSRSSSARRRHRVAAVLPVSFATASRSRVSAVPSRTRTPSSLIGRRGAVRPGPRIVRSGCTVQDAFVVGPADRGTQHPEPTADDRETVALGRPAGERRPDPVRVQRHDSRASDRIGEQGPHVGAVPDQCGRLPRVVRGQPIFQELGDREQLARWQRRDPTSATRAAR